jgi:excisionase family DNA binding protein
MPNCTIASQIEKNAKMLTPAQLAELLAVSPKSIYAWVKQGMLPAIQLGASIRFDPFTTAEWIRKRVA